MKHFFKAVAVTEARMMKLAKWTKKYAKFGAYAVVDEYVRNDKKTKWKDSLVYDVLLYCPTIHTKLIKTHVTQIPV
jgi:hypothetical protein